MEIIDSHIHLGDIYTGRPLKNPLHKIPFGLLNILELLDYTNPFKRGTPPPPQSMANAQPPDSKGRLLGDIAYMEVCRRIQTAVPKTMLKFMEEAGIDKAVILPVEPMTSSKEALEIAERHTPFIPFTSPDFTSDNTAEAVLKRVDEGAKGLKIHPVFQEIHPEDQRIHEVLESFASTGLPVCFHTGPARKGIVPCEAEGYAHPQLVAKLLKAFPSIPFIFAHMGLEYAPEVIELAQQHPNLYLETSIQPPRMIKAAIDAVGPERILFGSDAPLGNAKTTIRGIKKSCQDNEALTLIFSQNIRNLCGLENG